jgi:hypothetical protein
VQHIVVYPNRAAYCCILGYALVLENESSPGYMTEKILNAYLAGSVPIYSGPHEAVRIFNPLSMVWLDPDHPEPGLARIAELEANPDKYLEVANQSVFFSSIPVGGKPLYDNRNANISGADDRDAHMRGAMQTIQKYFSLADSIGGGFLKNRIRRRIAELGGGKIT